MGVPSRQRFLWSFLLICGIAIVIVVTLFQDSTPVAASSKPKSFREDDSVKRESPKPREKKEKKQSPVEEESSANLPNITWLVSFPNSGTSFTITNVEHMTQHSTASNYARDWKEIVPMRRSWRENGPFLHDTHLPIPARHVLTKTHCTAYCDDCTPKNYKIASYEDFVRGCQSGSKPGNVLTQSPLPTQVIHLIRNPFDNMVSRMHLALKRQTLTTDQINYYRDGRDGFMAWCQKKDQQYPQREGNAFNATVLALFEKVPCHADWFRYVQWHEYALQLTNTFRPKQRLLVHYDDYSTDFDGTVRQILDFVELPAARKPLPFRNGKTYIDFYTPDEQRAAKKLVKKLASPQLWKLLRRYFETSS